MSGTIGLFIIPVDTLVAGELSWKEYISSLTPEDLERQRQYDRAKTKKWYQENKEAKKEYLQEYYMKNKDKFMERHTCNVCGGSFQLRTKSKHEKTQKHQQALETHT